MRSVLEGYRDAGLFTRWQADVVWSHREGNLIQRALSAAGALVRVAGLLLRRRVDILHCHAAMRGSFWRKALFAGMGKAAGVPVVFHLHGSEFKQFYSHLGGVGKSLVRLILTHVDCVLVLSRSWADFLTEIAPRAKVEILPNFVAVPSYWRAAACESRTDSVASEVHVLFLGLVGQRKGVFDLLPAMKRALVQAPHLRLTIGGNGDLAAAQSAAKDLGVDTAVNLVGWVSGLQKFALLQSSDFYVLPSHNEGLPMSILEAMSYGLPVVSTRVGGIPELIDHGRDGLLIEAGDVEALADALVQLGNNPSLRHQMSSAARSKIEDSYSVGAVLPRLEQIYRSLSTRREVR